MTIHQEIIEQINKAYNTNYKLGPPVGEGHFVKVFDITGYKSSPDDTHEYVGRFTVKPTTDYNWDWIKDKTIQEYKLLTRADIKEKYVGKLCKIYTDPKKDPEWFFSIQKKYTPLSEHLKDELGETPSKEKKELIASKTFAELAEALCYVHSLDSQKGILLRDVKPDNIMYDADIDKCILCDFNTAREFNKNEYWAGSTLTVGTVEYMAPEIYAIEGGTENRPNPRQDVYSLGATIFSTFTRKSTKESPTDNSKYFAKEISDEKKIAALERSNLSRELQSIIYCTIQADPAKRYQDAEELFIYTSMLYKLRFAENSLSEKDKAISEAEEEKERLEREYKTKLQKSDKKIERRDKELSRLKKENEELKEKSQGIMLRDIEIRSLKQKNKALADKAEELDDLKEENAELVMTVKNLEKSVSSGRHESDTKKKPSRSRKIYSDEIKERCSKGFMVNLIWTILYALAIYFNATDILSSKSDGFYVAYIPLLFLSVPYYYAELFVWQESGSKKRVLLTFLRALIVSTAAVAVTIFADALVPNTYITFRMVYDVLWVLVTAGITYQYIKCCGLQKDMVVPATVIWLIICLALSFGTLPKHNTLQNGSKVVMGSYSADGETSEPLEWTVKRALGKYAYITCDKCIDYLPMNDNPVEDLDWEDSTLRTWLNGSFYEEVFTDEEKETILLANVRTEKNVKGLCYSSSVKFTADHVFIEDPLHAFLNDSPDVTEYAQAKRAESSDKTEKSWSWTRVSRFSKNNTTYFWLQHANHKGRSITSCEDSAYVRPAMLIDMSAYQELEK